MKKTAVALALMLLLGIVFVSGYAAAQNQKGTPGKGLIPINPNVHSTEKIDVVNHHVVSLSGAGNMHAKENVVNEHAVS
jgi:hypothetical protein